MDDVKIKALEGRGFSSNSYLISGDKTVLVDPGFYPELFDSIDPDVIICTHAHYDHIAAIPALIKRCGSKVWMGRTEAAYFEQDPQAASVSHLFGVEAPNFKINKALEPGEIIDFGVRLRVLETPGHSMGSICLFDEEDKTLLSGDTIFADGFGRYDLPGGSREVLIESIKSLGGLDVEKLYPGHGPTAEGRFAERIRRCLAII